MRVLFLSVVLAFLSVYLSPPACANGYRILGVKSAWANGMGEAVTARGGNPATIAYNPAGLAGLKGTQLGLHATFAELNADHKDAFGNTTRNQDDWQMLPSFYLSTDAAHEDIVLGLGVTVPNGFNTYWAEDSFARYVSTYSELKVIDTSPCAAMRIADSVRIGGGLNVLYSEVQLDHMVDAGAAEGSPGAMDVLSRLEGDGTGLGFTLGAIWDVDAVQSVGVSYRSAANVEYDGEVTVAGQSLDADTSVDFPASVAAGYRVRATDRVSVELDVDWTYWERVDSVTVDVAAPSEDVTIAQDFNNTFAYKLGLEYAHTDSVFLRGGYIFSEAASSEATWRPSLMDTESHLFTCGIGCIFDRITADLALIYVHYSERTIDNNVDLNESLSSSSVDGRYSAYSPVVSLGVTYRF